jgi:hypothetical protein
MRILSIAILFTITTFSAFSQNYDYLQINRRFNLANRTVRGITIDTAWVNASVDSLVTQYAIKGYLYNHYGPGTNNIYGLEHQLISIKADGSNQLEAIEPLVEGTFITTDQELVDAKLVFVDQATIFSQWKRISHGDSLRGIGNPNPSTIIPGVPSETNSWSYNAGTQTISSNYNSTSVLGFVSPQKYSNYTHKVTLTGHAGVDFDDNDYINVIAAYMEDANDLVPNNALGRNPADFSWPINTTSTLIPNQHTITLVRGRTAQDSFPFIGQTIRYALVYDFGKTSEQVLVNGEGLTGLWNTTLPYGSGRNCDVEIIRQGDIIKAYTTNWDDAPGGKGILRFELTYDLSSLDITQKFRGASAYGYGALSQENATFTDITSPNVNVIYDVRNGDKWVADFNGNYTLDTTTLYDDFGVRRWFYNPTTLKTIFYKSDRTFSIIGGNSVIDTTTIDNYTFNEEDFVVINREVSILPKPELDPVFLNSIAYGITGEDTARWNRIRINDSTFLDDRDFSDTGTLPIR